MKKILGLLLTFVACFAPAYSNNIVWSAAPTVISGALTNASNPVVAIDGSGNAVAAWIENNLVKASSKPVSGSWSAAATVSATGASQVQIVMDTNGNTTAVWNENGVIKAATKTLSGSWSASTALSTTGASAPTLCVDAAGDAIAAWVRAGNIETSTKLFGMNWQNRVTITSSSASTPVVAVGGTGTGARAVIVWHALVSSVNQIFTSTKLIGGTWSTAQQISESTHSAVQPYVAVDANANAAAVWYSYDTVGNNFTNVTVKSSFRSASTGVWSAVEALSMPGIAHPANLNAQVAFDSTGNAIALWTTSFDDQTYNLESAVRPVNGDWGTFADLIGANLYSNSVSLSSTTYGDVVGLYPFYNGAALLIQSIESDISGYLNNTWSVPITISAGTDNAFPKIAASINNSVIHAVAVWARYNGTNTSIVASTGAKSLVLPPSSLHVTQSVNNFGVFSEYYNTLTWTASTDANAFGYLVFRNGEFLVQVDASTTQYVDHNRVANGSVTYGVVTIDKQQTQSQTVNINFP